MIRKKLISCFGREIFSFQNGPDFTSCSIFSIPFLLNLKKKKKKFYNEKSTILELLSKLNLPAIFQWITKLYDDMS